MSRPPGNSLSLRIFATVGLTMLAATLVIAGIVIYEFRDHVQMLQDRGLSGEAAVIARTLQVDASGRPRLLAPPSLLSPYRQAAGDAQFAILDSEGALVFASPRFAPELIGTLARGTKRSVRFHYPGIDSEHEYRAVSVRRTVAGQDYFIQVARSGDQDDQELDAVLGEFFDEVLWVLLLLYGLILLVMFWTVKTVLRPLQAVSRQASAIAPDRFDIRLPTAAVPDEVLPVIEAMNKALDRLQEGYRTQREFTANAAHEIRTPLAVLRAHAESMDASRSPRDLLPDLARLERIVAQLLKLAQMETLAQDEFTLINLHTLAVDNASRLAPQAIQHQQRLAVTGVPEAWVRGNEAVLGAALGNLLENAIHYSGGGGEIEIHVDSAPAISVLDQGPGLPQGDPDNVFKRFWRGDAAAQPGAGLGLSIVAMIARAHQATVTAANRPQGGAVFCLRFPPAAPPQD